MKKITLILAATLACALVSSPTAAVTPNINTIKPAAPQSQETVLASVNAYESSGKGTKTLENITVGSFLSAAHFTHAGAGSFVVTQVHSDNTETILVDAKGKYDATVSVVASSPLKLKIVTTGDWTVTLNPGAYWDTVGIQRHIDPTCKSLQKATKVFGTVAEADTANRVTWCTVCTDGQGNQPVQTTASAPTKPSTPKAAAAKSASGLENLKYAPDTNEITGELGQTAYWTSGGKSYHFSKDCTSLKRSKNVKSGTLQDALNAGKKDPCNLCAGG